MGRFWAAFPSPSEWTALGTVGTFLVALAAAIIAYRQVQEARRLREDQARPYIVIDVLTAETSPIIIELSIRNIGTTAARDVRFEFTPPIASTLYADLMEWAIFKEGVGTMPPGREIRALFDSGPDRLEADLPKRYDVMVTYTDLRGRPQPALSFVLDIGALYDIDRLHVKGVHDAAKAMEGIRDILKSSRDGTTLMVTSKDYDYYREWARSVEAITGRRPSLGRPLPHEGLIAFGVSPWRRWIIRVVIAAWTAVREAARRLRGGDGGPGRAT